MKFFLASGIIFIVSFSLVHAGTLSLDPPMKEAGANDVFLVSARLDTDTECINAVEVELLYDQNLLQFVDFGKGGSLLVLWLGEPRIESEKGRISFAGGVPGGYCGHIRGDAGPSNVLAKIAFSFKPEMLTGEGKVAHIFFSENSRAYLNNGFGTEDQLKYVNTEIRLSDRDNNGFTNEWIREVRGDTIAPEFFTVSIEQDPSVADGKRFIVFSTTDKQSGLNHFEVLETDPRRFGFFLNKDKRSHWIVAESPYVLRDQTISSKIMVKAVDEAGNERIVEITPDGALFRSHAMKSVPELLILILLFVIGLSVFQYIIRSVDNKKEEKFEE